MRIPVIGGFNDTKEEMTKIAHLLKNEGINKFELLPYHNMGKHKYEALSLDFCEYYTPTNEQMKKFYKMIEGELK